MKTKFVPFPFLAGSIAFAAGLGLFAAGNIYQLPSPESPGKLDCVISVKYDGQIQEPYSISPLGRDQDGVYQMEFTFRDQEETSSVRDKVLGLLLDETVKRKKF